MVDVRRPEAFTDVRILDIEPRQGLSPLRLRGSM